MNIIKVRCCRLLAALLLIATFGGCMGSGDYVADSGGHLRRIARASTPLERFKAEVAGRIDQEATGVPQPQPYRNWREYWDKAISHAYGSEWLGTHEQVLKYVATQRRARGLADWP